MLLNIVEASKHVVYQQCILILFVLLLTCLLGSNVMNWDDVEPVWYYCKINSSTVIECHCVSIGVYVALMLDWLYPVCCLSSITTKLAQFSERAT